MPELLISLATIGGATIAAVASVLGINRFQNGKSKMNGGQVVGLLQEILRVNQEHNLGAQLSRQRTEEIFTTLGRDHHDILEAIERHRKEPQQG